jgi:3-isopropylmalate dehydrogenase
MSRLLLLPGDGIGPEVIAEVVRVAGRLANDLIIDERPFGGASLDLHGEPLTAETLQTALASDAVLMGAVGGGVVSKWANVPRDKRPEAGLLGLRRAMGVYANLRPALCFDALAGASALRPELVAGLDILIVRELTGGVYFGQPRFIETLPDGQRRAVDTQVYTTSEIERVSRVAFEMARGRMNKVTSCEKSNVMETGLLSDEAAMLTGGLGLLPSAAIGDPGKPGLYEPIHGSAPDIAGKGWANPLAAILSFEMALRWSLGRPDLADRLKAAVKAALDAGARTRDIGGTLSTTEMGDAVLARL